MAKPYHILHPIVFTLFPVTSLLAHNINQLSPVEGARTLVIAPIMALSLLCILGKPTRDWERAGLTTSLIMVTTLSFGHFYIFAHSQLGFPDSTSTYLTLIVLWLLFLASSIWFIWFRLRQPTPLGQAFTLAGAVMLVFPVYTLTASWVQAGGTVPKETLLPTGHSETAEDARPDIYYIILDGYARADILRGVFGYDNQPFINELQSLGFYVAPRSQTNYVGTIASLAASLNMDYLDELVAQVGSDSTSLGPLTVAIRESVVQGFLQKEGYRTVAIASGYDNTEVREVDTFLSSAFRGVNGFEVLLLQHTPFGPLVVRPGALFAHGLQYAPRRERILFALDALAGQIPQIDGPKYVFAHIVAPHPPFVFDAEGSAVQPDYGYTLNDGSHFPGSTEAYLSGYREQLIFINRQILSTLKQIIAHSSRPQVIIIQSDHGSGAYLDWSSPEQNTCLLERAANFTALLLPGFETDPVLYETVSPVNIFRIVFDAYFGTNLGLLADRTYFASPEKPYEFIEITDQVDRSAACLSSAGS